jgi:hypothetical protein
MTGPVSAGGKLALMGRVNKRSHRRSVTGNSGYGPRAW